MNSVREALQLKEAVLVGLLGEDVYSEWVRVKDAVRMCSKSSDRPHMDTDREFVKWLLEIGGRSLGSTNSTLNTQPNPDLLDLTVVTVKEEPEDAAADTGTTSPLICHEQPTSHQVQTSPSQTSRLSEETVLSVVDPMLSVVESSSRSSSTVQSTSAQAFQGDGSGKSVQKFYRCLPCDYLATNRQAILRHMKSVHYSTLGLIKAKKYGKRQRRRKSGSHRLGQPHAHYKYTLDNIGEDAIVENVSLLEAMVPGARYAEPREVASAEDSVGEEMERSQVLCAETEDDISVELVLVHDDEADEVSTPDAASARTSPTTAGQYLKLEPDSRTSDTSNTPAQSQPTFKCNICSKIFATHYYRMQHIARKHAPTVELSNAAGIPSVANKRQTVKHRKRKKAKPVLFKRVNSMIYCDHCLFSTKYYSSMHRHRRVQHGTSHKKLSARYTCEECGEQFRFSASLKKHEKIDHSKAKRGMPDRVEQTVQLSNGNIEYKCNICQFTTNHLRGLSSHKTKQHSTPQPMIPCHNNCGKSFKYKSLLLSHAKSCDRKHPTQWVQSTSAAESVPSTSTATPTTTPVELLPNETPQYLCGKCSREFSSIRGLKIHSAACFSYRRSISTIMESEKSVTVNNNTVKQQNGRIDMPDDAEKFVEGTVMVQPVENHLNTVTK